MIEDELFARITPVLRPLGAVPDEGEEFREPPLDVLRYYHRPVRLHWVPVLGRGTSVVPIATALTMPIVFSARCFMMTLPLQGRRCGHSDKKRRTE